jgi:outer membrane protein assembly factor BamB
MRIFLFGCLALGCFVGFGPDLYAQVKNGDWPQWRGPQRDAICIETGLLTTWPKGGPKLVWDSQKVNGGKSVGSGISSLAISQGKIYTMGDQGGGKGAKGDEFVYCLDADTGKEIWKAKIGPSYFNGNGAGPRCTPTVDGGRVYALSPQGALVCLKSATGAVIWQKQMGKDFGGNMMSGWGYSESPTVDGDKLICTPGGEKAAMVALDKATGAVVWSCKIPVKCGAGYSSIVTTEAGGVKQYITLMGPQLGLIGVDANTGKFLWNYNKAVKGTANIPTAVVHGDFVFSSTGYSAGAALLKLASNSTGVKADEVYFLPANKLQNHHGGVVMIGDYLYGGHGHNQGNPFCLEWKTGKFAWGPQRGEGSGSAAVLYADGNLYFRYQSGEMALVEATPRGYTLKGSFNVPSANTATGGKGWPHPVIYHGRLYLRCEDAILCYDIRNPK